MSNPQNDTEKTESTDPDAFAAPVDSTPAPRDGIKSAQPVNTNSMDEKATGKKLSGAYYYVATDESELAKSSFTRTMLTVIAFLLQVVILLLPQGGLEYITRNIASYAYVYMWIVFVMLAVSVYVVIMYYTRSKLAKRIPVERAPKRGFKKQTFFCTELYMAVNALMLAVEISFSCIRYDGYGLVAVFLAALALAAAVGARQVAFLTLRDAELIPAPTPEHA